MKSNQEYQISFHGSRFGSLNELVLPETRALYEDLRKFSDDYIRRATVSKAWPTAYPWPLDALHCNTRLWEYPFVLDAMRRHTRGEGQLLDIGSAMTFFPGYCAGNRFSVIASDIDARMKTWADAVWRELRETGTWPQPSQLEYRTEDATRLTLPSESCDVVTNISVLEHMPLHLLVKSLQEIHRVLRHGGVFICTLDCWIRGARDDHHHPLDQAEFTRFMGELTSLFTPVEPHVCRTPSDLITNFKYPVELVSNSPVFRAAQSAAPGVKDRLKSRLRLAVKGPPSSNQLEWCAFGITLRKE
ncbi:MAG: hypothetical protein GMKNLPBB_03117 [Myxococcota bacterium]|nr:hypothetical protein [Myxococcota bacterium]